MQRIRLRAPLDHGQSLNEPPLSVADQWVESNSLGPQIWPARMRAIRELAAIEIPRLAIRYSRQYCDCDDVRADEAESARRKVVMSGHQPTLFHAGVWYKNFALSHVSQRLDATGINLVVDNDICSNVSVAVPQQIANEKQWLTTRIAFDAAAPQVPYENCGLVDAAKFGAFGVELGSAIRPLVALPLIDQLWPEVMQAKQSLPGLGTGAWIAAGRHRLERRLGLRSLELPVSLIAKSQSFAEFFAAIVSEARRMAEIYNGSVREYRRLHHIRSRSHPVPELSDDGRWCEVPFWVWTPNDPSRRRLFVRPSNDEQIELSDRGDWAVTLSNTRLATSFRELNSDGSVCIRPRALMTTMFSRLFASDLFLHGIGGSKYDQLNDHIMQQFWNVTPPKYLTLTATMKLPIDFENVTGETISNTRVKIRQLDFQPERFIDRETAGSSVLAWLHEKKQLLANPVPAAEKKAWQDKIQSLNERLQSSLVSQRAELQAELERLQDVYPTSRMLGSREFSFALFPVSLIEQLKRLS